MSKVLITGGCGFIGSHVVDQMLSAGSEVLVLDNMATGTISNIAHNFGNPKFTLVIGDILYIKNFLKGYSRFDVVIHCAASCVRTSLTAPIYDSQVNARGTLEVLDYFVSSNSKRFVYISTSEVYGNHNDEICSEDVTVCRPQTVYAVSKLAGEYYTRVVCDLNRRDFVIIRPFNAYGPRAPVVGVRAEVIPRFIHQLLSEKVVRIFGDGTSSRDFTYVAELASGISKIAFSSLSHETINVGFGRSVSISELASNLIDILGIAVEAKVIHEPARPGDVRFLHADVSKLEKLYNWKPSMPIDSGLRSYLNGLSQDPDALKALEFLLSPRGW